MLVSYCVKGEGPQEKPGRTREAGWGKARQRCRFSWSGHGQIPQGVLEHGWYHRVLSLSRQGAGPWHHVPISHWPWPWSAHAGLWGASLDEMAILQRTMS